MATRIENVAYRPAPPGVPFSGVHPKLGLASASYCYRNAQDYDILWVTEHPPGEDAPTATGHPRRAYWLWEEPGKWVYHANPPGQPVWYRLNDVLRAGPHAAVWVFPTERECESFASTFPDEIVTTWSGGESTLSKVAWGALRSRQCRLWPPAQLQGQQKFLKAAQALSGSASGVWIVPADAFPEGLPSAADLKAILDSLQEFQAKPATAPPPNAPGIENAAMRQRRWGMVLNGSGDPYCNVDNAVRFLEGIRADNHAEAPMLWFDELSCRIKAGWGAKEREWADHDMVDLLRLAQGLYGGLPKMSLMTLETAVLTHAMRNRANPYARWLSALKWDGEKRIEAAFKRAWRVAENEYTIACSRVFFLQFANRVLNPGCQADYMMVLEGETGCGKTTSLEVLFGSDYVDTPSQPFGHKDFYQGLQGRVCIEVAEFAGRSGRDLDVMKLDITRKVDRFRPPYGRTPLDFPRRCIFVATTERDDWNHDDLLTARRFMPVRCGTIDRDLIRAEREQWFAEARERLNAGECTWDIPEKAAAEQQMARAAVDAIDDSVRLYLKTRREVTLSQVIEDALGLPDRSKWAPGLQHRVGRAMRRCGWISVRVDSMTRVWRNRAGEIQGSRDDPF